MSSRLKRIIAETIEPHVQVRLCAAWAALFCHARGGLPSAALNWRLKLEKRGISRQFLDQLPHDLPDAGMPLPRNNILEQRYKSFHNTVHSYLTGKPKFRIDELTRRFGEQAERVHVGT